MSIILPTFIIPGANKSGTSYVSTILNQHKNILMSFSKEPSFFCRHKRLGGYDRGIKFYAKNFIEFNGEKEIGEASTIYMYDPDSPALIKKHLGNCRLIFILRDPVDRVYSNYWQSIKGGIHLPDFHTFLTSGSKHAEELIYVSCYDIHLERFYGLFDKSRILVKIYEELQIDPRKFFKDITDFLELDQLPDAINFEKRVNPASIPRSPFIARLLKNRAMIQAAKYHIPASWGPKLRKFLVRSRGFFQKQINYPALEERSENILRERLQNTILSLDKSLDADLSQWKSYQKIIKA